MHAQFHLPILFDLGATFLFAITGAWVAIRKGYDAVGVFALALMAGVGGGMIRDVVFIAHGPPVAVQDSRYLLAVTAGAFFGMLSFRRGARFERLVAAVDALGLGIYGVVGTQKALEFGLPPFAALLAGMSNATGGGILRDVLVGTEPLVFQPGQFYFMAALAGCLVFLGLSLGVGLPVERAGWTAIAVTFVLRLLAIQFNWHTKPVAARWSPSTDEGRDHERP